jgi:hypothetical protein
LKLLGGVTILSTLAAPLLMAPPAAAAPPITAIATVSVTHLELSLGVPWTLTGDSIAGDHFVVKAHDPTVGGAPDKFCTSNIGAASLACTIQGVKAGVVYVVSVTAQDSANHTYATLSESGVGTVADRTPDEPGKPTGVTAASTGVSGQIRVDWIPGESADAILSGYTVTAFDAGNTITGLGCTAGASATTCNVDGLTDGAPYTFKVVANGANSTGNSDPSTASLSATPSIKPGVPTAVKGTPLNDDEIEVSWTAPSSTGVAVKDYTVTAYTADGEEAVGTAGCVNVIPTKCTMSQLDPNTPYTFKVVARNVDLVVSAASAASDAVIPVDAPNPPDAATAEAKAASAVVTWSPPSDTTPAVASYLVTAYIGADPTTKTCTSTGVSCTVSGLTNGVEYLFGVASIGTTGARSTATMTTDGVTPVAADVPGTPTGVALTAGVNQLTVNWSAASTNPADPISFVATATPGGATCSTANGTSTSCTITGLTAGTAYTVKVVARGADGDSAESAASDSAMPLSPSSGNTISNANGQLQIFVRGTNDHLYTSIRASDGSWGGAVDLGYPIVSAPTVVRNANGQLEVFVVGYGHLVYHRQQVAPNSTTWSGWAVVGASVWTSNFVVEANADGSLQLFGRDAAGNVRTAKQTSAGGADWTELATLGGLVFSDPTVASSGGKLEVFAIGYDGLLWHRMQSAANGTDWSAWARVGGSLTSIM